MTGTNLTKLISMIAEDLKDDPSRTIDDETEFLEELDKGVISDISTKIGNVIAGQYYESAGKHLSKQRIREISDCAAVNIFFATVKLLKIGGRRGLAGKVFTELPKLLELSA